jgi:hypothetical protein
MWPRATAARRLPRGPDRGRGGGGGFVRRLEDHDVVRQTRTSAKRQVLSTGLRLGRGFQDDGVPQLSVEVERDQRVGVPAESPPKPQPADW